MIKFIIKFWRSRHSLHCFPNLKMKWKLFHLCQNLICTNVITITILIHLFILYNIQDWKPFPILFIIVSLTHKCLEQKEAIFFLREMNEQVLAKCILCHRQNGFMLIKEGKRNWVWRMKEWISTEYSSMLLQRLKEVTSWIENWKVFLWFSNLPSWNLTKTVI